MMKNAKPIPLTDQAKHLLPLPGEVNLSAATSVMQAAAVRFENKFDLTSLLKEIEITAVGK